MELAQRASVKYLFQQGLQRGYLLHPLATQPRQEPPRCLGTAALP